MNPWKWAQRDEVSTDPIFLIAEMILLIDIGASSFCNSFAAICTSLLSKSPQGLSRGFLQQSKRIRAVRVSEDRIRKDVVALALAQARTSNWHACSLLGVVVVVIYKGIARD